MLGSRDLLQNPWTSILRFLALYAPLLPLSLPFVLDVIYVLQVLMENTTQSPGRDSRSFRAGLALALHSEASGCILSSTLTEQGRIYVYSCSRQSPDLSSGCFFQFASMIRFSARGWWQENGYVWLGHG